MRYEFSRAVGGVVVAAAILVVTAPILLAQRFSEWSAPVNLGSMVNSSAFDG